MLKLQVGLALCILVQVATELRGQKPQVLRGVVSADGTKPIANALVSVTMAPDRALRQSTTASDGSWSVRFERTSGDYLVHVAAVGHEAYRKRIAVPVTDTLAIVNVTLVASVQRLAAVSVQAARPKPEREGDGRILDGLSAEYSTMGVAGAISPELQGNLTSMAETIPGLSVTPGGISTFGLDPSQNSVTLNGLAFPGGSLPRNTAMSTRFTTSTYDPSRGGFAGVETAVTLAQGNAYSTRRANITLDAPFLQTTDRIGRQLGSRVTSAQASLGSSGMWVEDTWYYNISTDLSRKVNDVTSLVTPNPEVLPVGAVASDSVAHLIATLSKLGIPVGVPGFASQRMNDEASVSLRIDHSPYRPQSLDDSPSTWAVVALGKVQRQDALGVGLTSTPSRGGRSRTAFGTIQLLQSSFVNEYSLAETRSAFSVNYGAGEPYVRLPEGSVQVASQLPDGSVNTSMLAFGGGGRNEWDETTWNWETRTDYQRYLRATHRIKVTAQSRLDGYAQQLGGNSLGMFTFASLADLGSNRPSSFTRTLFEPVRRGTAWSGFAAVGDVWRASPKLQLIYGIRAEANRFFQIPKANTLLERTLGARTNQAPSPVHLSPRFGFVWRYAGAQRGFAVSSLGMRLLPSAGLLRGGIGEFRSTMPPQLACAGGIATLNDASPAVQVIDPSFDAPRSWRANVGWAGIMSGVALTIDGSIALNLNQTSWRDLNFSGVQRFTLPEEGRPVFVNVDDIAPSSGFLSSVAARRSPLFASVMNRQADLRSSSRQFTVTASPTSSIGVYMLNAAYTYGRARADARGFDGAAFGNPEVIERARSDFDVRHRVQLQLARAFPGGFSASLSLNVASGLPFTPVVYGDVNGDGRSMDRAFIYDPARTTDSTLAAGMRELIRSAPSRVRGCLTEQLGSAAGRNSCEGPWAATATARVGLGIKTGPFGRRANAAVSITNPLGGLDQILHGDNDLRGWGMNIRPDPILLTVRGFDPATPRFLYQVNPRFGNATPSQTTVRVPFRITLDVILDLGPATGQQQLERVLNRGRNGRPGLRLSADSIRTRFARNVPNPYSLVIREADSLLISREQLEALRAGEARFRVRTDSLWLLLARELAELSDGYDVATATRQTEATTEAVWEVARSEGRRIKDILSPLQYTLAPGMVQYLGNVEGRVQLRMYSY